MRAVVQRVKSASVSVDGQLISSIGKGLLVFVGIGKGTVTAWILKRLDDILSGLWLIDDTAADVDSLTNKMVSFRLWPDPTNDAAWKHSVKDIGGDILCVSQFTLMANTTKGKKPDFHRAMAPELSRTMYKNVLDKLGVLYNPEKIKDGQFGAMMDVSLVNDGPVTFTLDSRKTGDTPPTTTETNGN